MTYRFATLFVVLFTSFLVVAQQSKIDSLKQVIQETSVDTIKVSALLEIAREYRNAEQTDNAEDYVAKAKESAVSIGFRKGEAISNWIFGDLDVDRDETVKAIDHYFESIEIFESIERFDLSNKVRYDIGVLQLGVGMYEDCIENLEKVSKYQAETADTIAQITTLGRMANAYQRKGDYQSSIDVSEKGLILAKLADAPLRAAVSLNNLGIVYRNKGEPAMALDYYYQALDFAKEGGNLFFQAAFLENIGIVHSNKGEYVESLRAYFQALKIYEEQEDEASQVWLGFNIGLVYKLNKEYEKALPYYKRSLEYDILHLDTLGIINSQHNLGSAYLDMGEMGLAKKYLLASFRLVNLSQINCLDGVSGLLGKLYYEQGKIDSAEYYINLELSSLSQCETYANYPEVAYLMGLVEQSYGRSSQAHNYFKSSYEKAISAGYQEVINQSSYALYEWYKKRGENKQALMYHEAFQQSTDSLFNQENTRKLAWLEANYQMDQAADSLTQVKENEARTFNKTIEDQQWRQTLIIVISLALLVILFALYLYLRKRRELKYQFALSEERNTGFRAVINATEEERKRIAKDLHDGVVQQIAAVKLTLSNVVSKLPKEQAEEVTKAKEMAEAAAEETRNISHQMMPKVLIEVGLIPAMEEVISNTLITNQLQVDFQQHGLKERYENRIEIAVYRIFQELVNNIIKHSKAKHVDIQLMENGGRLLLIVEDDGVGIKQGNEDGIGLSNIKSRLTTIDGKVDYTSGETSGTVATIVIPL